MSSPTLMFQRLFSWCNENNLDRSKLQVTIRIDDPVEHDRFVRAWIRGEQLAYAEAGHKNPTAVNFLTYGTLYDIPFRIEGPLKTEDSL